MMHLFYRFEDEPEKERNIEHLAPNHASDNYLLAFGIIGVIVAIYFWIKIMLFFYRIFY